MACTEQCVDGCFCKDGLVRNAAGVCVAVDQCVEINPTCENELMVHQWCGTACPLTCENYANADTLFCTEQCVEGCFCQPGFVLHEGACVRPRDCPVTGPMCAGVEFDSVSSQCCEDGTIWKIDEACPNVETAPIDIEGDFNCPVTQDELDSVTNNIVGALSNGMDGIIGGTAEDSCPEETDDSNSDGVRAMSTGDKANITVIIDFVTPESEDDSEDAPPSIDDILNNMEDIFNDVLDVLDNLGIDKPEVPKERCGRQGYNPIRERCCTNEDESFHWVTGLFEQCGENCGKLIFDPRTEMCCNHQMYDFDTNTYVSLMDRYYISSIEKGCRDYSQIEYCGRTPFNPQREQCCELVNAAGMTKFAVVSIREECPQPEQFCNGQVYHPDKAVCCEEPGYHGSMEFLMPAHIGCPEWCGYNKYDPRREQCCELEAPDLEIDINGEVFDSDMIIKPPAMFYVISIKEECYEKPEYEQCGKLQNYDPATHQCCSIESASGEMTYKVVSLERKCPSPLSYCADKTFNEDTHMCCKRPLLYGFEEFLAPAREGCPEFCGLEQFDPKKTKLLYFRY
jgi:hypothetical protein